MSHKHNQASSQALNAIARRLSLRKPQEDSLRALAQAVAAAPDMFMPQRDVDSLLKTLNAEFPTVTDFERAFPSFCFALATGVGKTRLMGAFISYLHLAHGIKNFFVLAPNLTIYNKLITDFTPNTPKYVFTGIAEFAACPPEITTGENYAEWGYKRGLLSPVRINIFNIAKIVSEVRGGKSPRIKRLSEYLGDSYFNYLSELDDLVLLMDESHRYRANAGMRAINELNPRLGLELTATPFTESKRGPAAFKNVIVDYPLACAMDDGFVKEPAVVTQRNFDPRQYSKEQVERVKLEDGIRMHEVAKLELFTYAKQHNVKTVKPFMLVISRDTTHASQLLKYMESDAFFNGRYKGKVIQVDSSKSSKAAEEEMILRLLAVESMDEPTEIVIHVNMLKEGWDVTNLYTIVPLRAANARTLIEQSIGRGLRLPYGKRTGVDAVDRLSIVAHDRFQEIVDEANDPNNPLRIRQLILEKEDQDQPKDSVTVPSKLEALCSGKPIQSATGHDYQPDTDDTEEPVFNGADEHEAASAALRALQRYQDKPEVAPVSNALFNKDIQEEVYHYVSEQISGRQQSLLEDQEKVKLQEVIAKTTKLMVEKTIDIPRIMLVPSDGIRCGYTPFVLEMDQLNLQPTNRELISQSLQSNEQISISAMPEQKYQRLEDYIVDHLVDFDDIPYDEHAEFIYDLATQAVNFFRDVREYSEDELHNIFFGFGKRIAENIHAQMADHYWEEASYEITVSSGFVPLKDAAYTTGAKEIHDIRNTVIDKSKIRKMLFGGFKRCLYEVQKFDSDTERTFALILEREALKWFKPVSDQFHILYKDGINHKNYLPDFIAELDDKIIMVETKARKDLEDTQVINKAKAAREWCSNASDYLVENGGKPWKYLLIPHDEVLENLDLLSYEL